MCLCVNCMGLCECVRRDSEIGKRLSGRVGRQPHDMSHDLACDYDVMGRYRTTYYVTAVLQFGWLHHLCPHAGFFMYWLSDGDA